MRRYDVDWELVTFMVCVTFIICFTMAVLMTCSGCTCSLAY